MSEPIHQEVVIPASRADVYGALTDAKKFSEFSGGGNAEIDARAGGGFSLFGGRITGLNVFLDPDKRVVQAWRAENWAPGEYSLVRFALSDDNGGTRVVFDQTGHPDGTTEHLTSGWGQMYWTPMKERAGSGSSAG